MIDPAGLCRHDAWDGVRAVVAGFGAAGFAAADNLTHLGAAVTALDESAQGREDEAELLEVLGARIRLEPGATAALPEADLVVASPGWESSPLVVQARERGLPVWGEVDLAWRLRDPEHPTPWLCVTGARDTTRAVRMLEAVLDAAGLRTVAAGAAGLPIVEVVMDPEPYDVLAVGLTADQLRGAGGLAAESAAVLDVGDARPADLGRVYEGVRRACVYLPADPATEELVREADVVEGARAVGVTPGVPAISMLGVVEDLLVDRAFIAERGTSAAELCAVADVPEGTSEAVLDALVAAALARAHGVDQVAVRDGLRVLKG